MLKLLLARRHLLIKCTVSSTTIPGVIDNTTDRPRLLSRNMQTESGKIIQRYLRTSFTSEV